MVWFPKSGEKVARYMTFIIRMFPFGVLYASTFEHIQMRSIAKFFTGLYTSQLLSTLSAYSEDRLSTGSFSRKKKVRKLSRNKPWQPPYQNWI